MRFYQKLFFLIIICLFILGCSTGKKFPSLKGDYLGQSFVGETPELFAPGVVSRGMYERDVAIPGSGEEFYFGFTFGGWKYVTIMESHIENGKWTQPEVAQFASDPSYYCFEPAITYDGKKIYFLCTKPREGQEPRGGWFYQNIWAADRLEDGSWTEPYDPGEPINTETYNTFFPSLTRDGTLYFTQSERRVRNSFISRSALVDGKYTKVEVLPDNVNGKGNLANACIASDESYLIACVTGRDDLVSPGFPDYYVYFRNEKDEWSEGINLGETINIPETRALSPALSPDGKYFFFALDWMPEENQEVPLSAKRFNSLYNSPQNGLADIYWVSTSVIEGLRPEGF